MPADHQAASRRDAPYVIVGDLQRFNERNVAFARSQWDETCYGYGRPGRLPDELAATGKAGYGFADYALGAGAWAMAHRIGRDIEPRATDGAPRDLGGPEALTRATKDAALFYGAALVGIADLNPLWVYCAGRGGEPIELPDGLTRAVVIAVEMDYKLIGKSPSAEASAATGRGYSQMAVVATSVAQFLADLGWRALPCGNDTALSVPLAVDAGLGELGRNGILVTEPYGPRVRLCKVLTDAPLAPDAPRLFGVRHFCEVCLKCADACPSRSITTGKLTESGPTPSNNPGVLKWYVNPETCLAFWRSNATNCSNCIRACPYNKPPGLVHDAARWLARRRRRATDRLLVLMDNLFRYG